MVHQPILAACGIALALVSCAPTTQPPTNTGSSTTSTTTTTDPAVVCLALDCPTP